VGLRVSSQAPRGPEVSVDRWPTCVDPLASLRPRWFLAYVGPPYHWGYSGRARSSSASGGAASRDLSGIMARTSDLEPVPGPSGGGRRDRRERSRSRGGAPSPFGSPAFAGARRRVPLPSDSDHSSPSRIAGPANPLDWFFQHRPGGVVASSRPGYPDVPAVPRAKSGAVLSHRAASWATAPAPSPKPPSQTSLFPLSQLPASLRKPPADSSLLHALFPDPRNSFCVDPNLPGDPRREFRRGTWVPGEGALTTGPGSGSGLGPGLGSRGGIGSMGPGKGKPKGMGLCRIPGAATFWPRFPIVASGAGSGSGFGSGLGSSGGSVSVGSVAKTSWHDGAALRKVMSYLDSVASLVAEVPLERRALFQEAVVYRFQARLGGRWPEPAHE
jgi:hypothetical protein